MSCKPRMNGPSLLLREDLPWRQGHVGSGSVPSSVPAACSQKPFFSFCTAWRSVKTHSPEGACHMTQTALQSTRKEEDSKLVVGQLTIHLGKHGIKSILHTKHKTHSRWTKALNVKSKTFRVITGKYLYNLRTLMDSEKQISLQKF